MVINAHISYSCYSSVLKWTFGLNIFFKYCYYCETVFLNKNENLYSKWMLSILFLPAELLPLMSSSSSPSGSWLTSCSHWVSPTCPVQYVAPSSSSAGRCTTPARVYKSSDPSASTKPSLRRGKRYLRTRLVSSLFEPHCLHLLRGHRSLGWTWGKSDGKKKTCGTT